MECRGIFAYSGARGYFPELTVIMAEDLRSLEDDQAINDEERKVAEECVKANIGLYFQEFRIRKYTGENVSSYTPRLETADGGIDRSGGECKFVVVENHWQ